MLLMLRDTTETIIFNVNTTITTCRESSLSQ